MSELLHCPFCGGKQTYRKHDGGVWLTTTNHKRGCIMREALSFVAFNTEAEAIAAWNTRAERTCTLTAEQVMAIAGKHQPDYCSDTHVCFDWQAIADELNTRAERTCECVAEHAKSPIDGKTIVLHRCSACHELMRPHMAYCPNCGAKVVGE